MSAATGRAQVRVNCGRCGEYIGKRDTDAEASALYRDHIQQCEVVK